MSEAKDSAREPSLRQFKPYRAYKDSGVEWLGEIPAHWEVAPVYARFEIALGKMLDAKRVTGEFSGRYVRNVDVQWDAVNADDLPEMDFAPWERERYLLRLGDLLVCEGGEVGRTAIWRGELDECFYQKAIHRVRPRSAEESSRFFYYLMYTFTKCGVFVAGGNANTIDHLTAVQLRHYRMPFASPLEQRAIAAFLDRETARIDGLVAKKERLIELLQEQRTALITRAVTKGLDPNVPMKNSGIEWLDVYPRHWTGLPLKRWITAKITDGPHETPELVPEGVDFVSAEAVSNGQIDFNKRRGFITADLHEFYCRKCRPARDDILICKSGATTGKLARVDVDVEFSVWSPLALVRACRSRVLPRFLELALGAEYVQKQIKRTWSAGTQPNISMGDLEQLFVVAPQIDEQYKILDFIERRTGEFGRLGSRIHDAIERLKELRTALISAAVTGKIDVREEAA
ncbi:MAG: restriction endonuclease subunit S [Steroidobacteraceae bacterium]